MSSVTAATSVALMTNLAIPPIMSIGLAEMTMAQSISGVMYNATNAEKQSQIIQNTAVAQCCALIIACGAAKA